MTWKIRRYRRWGYVNYTPAVTVLITAIFFTVMIFLGFEVGSRITWNIFFLPKSQAAESEVFRVWRFVGLRGSDWKSILGEVLPVASYLPGYVEDESTGFLVTAMQDITTADLRNPETFFDSQIAYFDSVPVNAEPEYVPEEEPVPDLPPPEGNSEDLVIPRGTGPLVGIYCTHSAESYVPTQGVEKLEGKNGGVFLVAQHLKETLENKYGIPTVQSSTIHDYPDWSKSYTNSLVTLEQMKKDYPSINIFIDVHRDALTSRASTTGEVNGKKVSKIMFIVGSDARLPHPNWEQNLAFAKELSHVMDQMYPGLLKGVRVQDGRYNQHVSTHAVLVEMGSTENSLEESKLSAELLAGVINNVIKQRQY